MSVTFEQELYEFIQQKIPDFHRRRLESLQNLKLEKILRRKNPYLFRAKNTFTAEELVRSILEAHIFSQEETLFGDILEQTAIFICKRCYGGRKSSAEGIDLEFMRDGIVYIVSIKSGPNWGNSSQIKRMQDNFRRAKKILNTNTTAHKVIAVNGCCYGKGRKEDKGDYLKLCGEKFWTLISGKHHLYIELIEPIGHEAKKHNEDFKQQFVKVINRFTFEFLQKFCLKDGEIDWKQIVRFNSSAVKNRKIVAMKTKI